MAQLDANPQPTPKQQDPGLNLDPVSIETNAPSPDSEQASSSLSSSGIVKDEEEDLWKDRVSAWGSLSTHYDNRNNLNLMG